jgi:hypothetical protein
MKPDRLYLRHELAAYPDVLEAPKVVFVLSEACIHVLSG